MSPYASTFKPAKSAALWATISVIAATGSQAQPWSQWKGPNGQEKPTISEPELAFPDRRGEMIETLLLLPDGTQEPIQYELIDGEAVYQGDIILNVDEKGYARFDELHDEPTLHRAAGQAKSAGRTGASSLWPGNVVYYEIDSGLSNTSRVTNAIAHWENNTYLTFIESSSAPDRIRFRSSSGCSSPVGRQGGVQYVDLASDCSTGNTIHEIGHAVGLFHEHTRQDRNNYVTILWSNIESGYSSNFKKYTVDYSDGADLGSYDPDSVMHYSCTAFGKGQTTIQPNSSSWCNRMGQRDGLSEIDVDGVNTLYPPWHYDVFGSLQADLAASMESWSLLPPNLLMSSSIVGADVDGDGDDELVALAGPQLMVLEPANPFLILAMDPISGAGGTDLAAVDRDGDGVDEIAVLKSNGVHVYEVPSGGPFWTLVDTWTLSVPAAEIAGVDHDGDGVDELVVRFGNNLFLFSEEALLGQYLLSVPMPPDMTIASIDHEGDGIDEIAVASPMLRLVHLFDSSTVQPYPVPTPSVASDVYAVAVGSLRELAGVDVDGDGIDEIATVKY